MHFSARSALIVSSCLALGVRALPVTYSVVDVDGGSAAAAAPTPTAGSGSGTSSSESSADQPATIYVTKSTEIEEPEATTVSVSITIIETKHAMPKPTSVSSSSSASSSPSPSEASAQAPSTTLTPSSTDALSVLSSAQSTLMTSHTKPGPSPSSAPQSKPADQSDNVTVTSDLPNVTETVVPPQETVVILSTTTIVSDAAAASTTSYYDDGMWHTRYAIKPSAAPEKPAAKAEEAPPNVNIVFEAAGKKQVDEAEFKVEDVPAPAEKKQTVATNTTSQATNGTYHTRRQVQRVAATPTMNEEIGTSAPEILVHPIRPQASGLAPQVEPNVVARAASTGDATAVADVLSADVAERAAPAGYSVVSWNETMEA
jgi:hypothetical protein